MIAAAVGTKATWYLTRGSGMVALLLLTASVILGVLTTVRWQAPRWPRFITAALHGNVSLLALCFLAVHIVTAVVDGFAPIGWLAVVVPFASPYRPLWLGLGAVAFDLLLAISLTTLIRRQLGYRAWRAIHWSSYACWPIAALHSFGTGSDTRVGWALAVQLGCLAAVVLVVWWRLLTAAPSGRRTWAAAASFVLPMMLIVWLAAGPLRPGWARRAGTPTSLLQSTTRSGG